MNPLSFKLVLGAPRVYPSRAEHASLQDRMRCRLAERTGCHGCESGLGFTMPEQSRAGLTTNVHALQAWQNGLASYLALAVTEEELASLSNTPAFDAMAQGNWQVFMDNLAGLGPEDAVADMDQWQSQLTASNASACAPDLPL